MTTFKARSYGFLLWSDRLIQVKTIEIPSLGLCKKWPRPFNRGDRLIEVTFRVIKRINFRDFYNWPLNRGWPFNTGLLNTGLTVSSFLGTSLVPRRSLSLERARSTLNSLGTGLRGNVIRRRHEISRQIGKQAGKSGYKAEVALGLLHGACAVPFHCHDFPSVFFSWLSFFFTIR